MRAFEALDFLVFLGDAVFEFLGSLRDLVEFGGDAVADLLVLNYFTVSPPVRRREVECLVARLTRTQTMFRRFAGLEVLP